MPLILQQRNSLTIGFLVNLAVRLKALLPSSTVNRQSVQTFLNPSSYVTAPVRSMPPSVHVSVGSPHFARNATCSPFAPFLHIRSAVLPHGHFIVAEKMGNSLAT